MEWAIGRCRQVNRTCSGLQVKNVGFSRGQKVARARLVGSLDCGRELKSGLVGAGRILFGERSGVIHPPCA